MQDFVEDSNMDFVATPDPGSTRLADPNRNPEDARLILFIYSLFHFLFQKCHGPNPRLDPKGRSEPELGLLRRFHLSYQTFIYVTSF